MPVEFQVLTCRVRLVLLNSVADVSEDLCLCGVIDLWMILDLINGSEAEVSRGDGLLGTRWEFDDRDVEGSGGFFEDLEGALLLGLHVEFNFDNIIKVI